MRLVTSSGAIAMLLLVAVTVTAAEPAPLPHLDAIKSTHDSAAAAARIVTDNLLLVQRNKIAEMTYAAAQVLTQPRHRGFEARDVTSTPAPTCDAEGFAAAQVVVLQACPSLSGLVSGTVSILDFLPTFCGSNCYSVISANLPKFRTCLDATSLSLVGFITGCASTPECYKSAPLTTALTLQATCTIPQKAAFNFYNATTAASADVTKFCTSCYPQYQTFLTAYPTCSGSSVPASALLGAMNAVCTKTTSGDYCAWNLRSLGYIDCNNNCLLSPWCSSSCTLQMTTSRLDTMCANTCLAGLAAYGPAVGFPKPLVMGISNSFCFKAPNTTDYCYSTATSIMTSSSIYTSSTLLATACSGTNGVCLGNYFTQSASLTAAIAGFSLTNCASSFTTTTLVSAYCRPGYESQMRTAEQVRQLGRLVCATNANGAQCLPYFYSLAYTSTCYSYAAIGTCSSSCSTTLLAVQSAAQCCLGPINGYLRSTDSSYANTYLPSTLTVTMSGSTTGTITLTSRYAQTTLVRSQQPMNAIAYCSNTSDLWGYVENMCPASTNAVSRTLKVYISYAAATATPAIMKRILDGLIADAANAARVPPSSIKNASITRDTSITVTTSRRASDSGVSFNFAVDAASASDAAAAASAFDTSVSSGSFSTVNTAAAVATCSGCTTSSDTSSLTGSGSTPSTPKSSAATATVALVGLLAVTSTLLL